MALAPVNPVQNRKHRLKFVATVFLSNNPAGIAVNLEQLLKQPSKFAAAVFLLNSPAGMAVSPVQ